jgi:PKD repeat protein
MSVPAGGSVHFTDQSTNSPTSWSWSFEGGTPSTSTAQNPTVTYNTPGTYDVSLTATNSAGSDSETKLNYITVTAPQPPVANFTASTTNPSVGGSVTFTDTSTNGPTSWSWTFEGGTPATSTAQNPTVTYNTVGTYDVTLVATNAAGSDTETKTDYINVSSVPYCTSSGGSQSYEYISRVVVADLNNQSGASPYTDYTSLVAHVTQGNSVSVSLTPGFTGSSYTEYWRIWIDYNGDHDFADTGEQAFSGSGSSVVSGSFTVPTSSLIGATRMRVSMSYSTYPPYCGTFTYGEVEDYTVQISGTTPQPPVANFTASDTNINVGQSVTFTDQSTNNPTSWSWSFEGGTPSTSTAQNPTITYNTAGTFNVTLTATNSAGSDAELKVDYITVTSTPTTYCSSQGSSQADEWIARVRVANLDHSSGASPYSDFTSYTANLTRGVSASVILNTGYAGYAYREYWRIFIDYNQDGDFIDSGETVFSKNGRTSVSGSFTTSSSATVGNTRMRVSMKYGSYPTSCETFTYGEVEDYTANIQ